MFETLGSIMTVESQAMFVEIQEYVAIGIVMAVVAFSGWRRWRRWRLKDSKPGSCCDSGCSAPTSVKDSERHH